MVMSRELYAALSTKRPIKLTVIPSLQFTGNGTVDVPVILACAKEPEEAIEWCLMSNLFIKADFLSSPIAINPTTPKWPYSVDDLGGQVDDSNCDVRSRYPGWRIDNFRYRHVSTSSSGSSGIGNLSHIKGDSQYDVTFNVTNAVMNATTSCYARVNETAWPNPDHAPLWADCVTPGAAGTVGGIPPGTSAATVAGSASLDAAAAIVRTQVLVDREYGLVGINQTWRCLDGSGGVAENADNAAGGVLAAGDVASGPASDKLYGGVGYIAPVDLLCGTATSNTDTTTSLTTKEFNCTLPQNASTGVISGWAIPAPPLPHTSYMKSCTVNSVAATALQLTEYNYVSAQDQTEGSVLASIAVRNPGSGDEFHMVDVPLRVDGQWHDCVFGSQPYPWQLVTCRYMLDNGSRGVGFQLAWFCDDRDPLHP